MLTSAEIRRALADMIKKRAALPLAVYFDGIENSAEDYAFVMLRASRFDEGRNYFVRKLRVDIQVVLSPLTGRVKHTDLLDIADKLDAATHGYLQVNERKITITETEMNIYDGVLNYSFELNFADSLSVLPEEIAEYDYAENLYQNY